MAKQFYIPEINPIPFRQLIQTGVRYNTIPFDLQATPKTVNGCYYQKWELTDKETIQFLSDYNPDDDGLTIEVFKLNGKSPIASIVPVPKITNIVGQTFTVYEAEFDFSDFGKGYFFARISFTDEDNILQTYESQAWHTDTKWLDTVLIQYKNSFNNYAVVFDTGIEFGFRVEAQIREYSPQFDDEVYIDQEYIPTQLSSIPFKQFKLVTRYLPDWALTILNAALNVDAKRIDNVYFEKLTNSKLEINRVDGYEYGYASIEVIPIRDFFLQRLKVGDMADGLFTIITKRLQYINNAVDREITGVFRGNTNLRRIDIINIGGTAFTVNVGTTNGGAELGTIDVAADDETAVILIHKLFDSDTTVYITGLDGEQTNVFVIFDQDDEEPIDVSAGVGVFKFPRGFCGFFEPTDATHLNDMWDLASGLGKPGTPYSNCAIRDGRNGTNDETDAYDTGVPLADIDTLMSTIVGANAKKILIPNLPKHKFRLFKNTSSNTDLSSENPVAFQKNAGINRDYIMSESAGGSPTLGSTNEIGNDEDFNVRPKSFYKLPFKAITD